MQIIKELSRRPILKNTVELTTYFLIGAAASLATEKVVKEVKSEFSSETEKSSEFNDSGKREIEKNLSEKFVLDRN